MKWMEGKQLESCTNWMVESRWTCGTKTVTKFRCHRNQRNTISTKSRNCLRKKLSVQCPVRAKVTTIDDGPVLVEAYFNHNHELHPALSRLLESERTILKTLLDDDVLDNCRVKQKLNQLSLHKNSRLKYLNASHIADLRRHWGHLKYQRSKDEFESLRLRFLEQGAKEGVQAYNSINCMDPSEFYFGMNYLFGTKRINGTKLSVVKSCYLCVLTHC